MSEERTLSDQAEQDQHEEWRGIPGFPLHQVSSIGRVRRFFPGNWRYPSRWKFLKPWGNVRHHYLYVSLKSGLVRAVHRLVLEAFVGSRPEEMECRHLDGNRCNNRLDNLRWGTRDENMQDKMVHGRVRHGSAVNFAKLTEADVLEIKRLLTQGLLQREIADKFTVRQSCISRIKSGLRWAHLGAPSE